MKPSGTIGDGGQFHRKMKIAASVVPGQIVCYSAAIAAVAAPSSNSSYANAVGIVLDAANLTYSTTQGNGANSADVLADVTYHPLQTYLGRVSSNATSFVAQGLGTPALAGGIIAIETANATGVTANTANIGTANYQNGMLVGLTGNNAGQSRGVTGHSANTSHTVTVPFDYGTVVGDTMMRTFKAGSKGMILTTNYVDFYQVAAGGTCPTSGNSLVIDVLLDGMSVMGHQVTIVNASAPEQQLLCLFSDHIYNLFGS